MIRETFKHLKEKYPDLYISSVSSLTLEEARILLDIPDIPNMPEKVVCDTTPIKDIFDSYDLSRIKRIVFHCTATPLNTSISAILRYWKEDLGWRNPGYHVMVKSNGEYKITHPFNKISNGVKGHNHDALHIAGIFGMLDNGNYEDNSTPEMKEVMEVFLEVALEKIPNLKVYGHYELAPKLCPLFEPKKEFKHLL